MTKDIIDRTNDSHQAIKNLEELLKKDCSGSGFNIAISTVNGELVGKFQICGEDKNKLFEECIKCIKETFIIRKALLKSALRKIEETE